MAFQQLDLADALAELSKLTTDELKDLCNSNSNEKYDELVDQNDKVKSLQSERELLLAAAKSLAEVNLGRQHDYESDRYVLLNLVVDSNRLKDEIQAKAMQLLELSKKTSLESTLAIVLAAAAHAEEDSESIAKSFLSNSLDYDTFVSEYSDKRKLAHMRRIKADKLRTETEESWTGIRSQPFNQLSQ